MPADNDSAWRQIVAKSATISERIAAYRAQPRSQSAELDPDLADLWCEVSAAGNSAKFAQRLAYFGLTIADVPGCLAEPDTTGQELPKWSRLLVRAGQTASDGFVNQFVDAGLAELAGLESEQLSSDLTQSLRLQLSALVVNFKDEEPANTIEFWTRYPALARLAGITLQLWIDRTTELLQRADSDIDAINRHFDLSVTGLSRVSTPLSDPHNGHARVVACTFVDADDRDVQLIYKPKDLGTEEAFAELCRWVNERGADVGDPLTVLAMQGYGWVERAAAEPATNAAQVERFYRRCGALGALLFALDGTDCTAENMVARADTPLVIDAETMLQPRLDGRVRNKYANILDTLLFPRWIRTQGGVVDVSALGFAVDNGLKRSSDLIDQTGALTVAAEHERAIQSGFEQTWNVLATNSDGFIDGPVAALADEPLRVLIRVTQMYDRLHTESLRPDLLTDGLYRSIFLDRLARKMLNEAETDTSLGLAELERQQLERADIPLFTTLGNAHELATASGQRLIAFSASAMKRVTERVALLSDDELDRQREYIATALAVSRPGVRSAELLKQSSASIASMDADSNRAACIKLLHEIPFSVEQLDRGPQLVGLLSVSPDQWGIGPLDASLDDGYTGVALAMFAASRALDDPGVERDAVALLKLEATVAQLDRFTQVHGRHGPSGADGLVHGWSLCAAVATNGAYITDVVASIGPSAPVRTAVGGERGDALSGGLAGRAEELRASDPGSLQYRDTISTLAGRALKGELNFGVPSGSALPSFGLAYGISGVLYALAASLPGHDLPNLASG